LFASHDSRRTVLVIGGGEVTDARLMDALAADPSYRPVLYSAGTTELAAALAGVDTVMNCIAGSPRTILATTEALCDVARRDPPRRIIHLSSMAIYGGAEGLVTEATEPAPPLNAYAKARIQCEALVRQYVADGGDAVIIRPGCVFGPESKPWADRIARLLVSRRLGDLGPSGDGICNLIHVDDLVAMMITTINAPDIRGEIFNAAADQPRPTWNEFLIRFARAIGATPVQRISARRMKVEVTFLAPMLRAAALAAGPVRRFIPEAMTPSFVRLLGQNITLSSAKASARLDVTHRPLDQAIEETARWWRSRQEQSSLASAAPAPHPAPHGEAGR
jgi:nucleoside-diphosphate-sugar epimerase